MYWKYTDINGVHGFTTVNTTTGLNTYSWVIHNNILMCSEVTLDILPWRELQWATVSICMRLVQMEPIQWLLRMKAQWPLATVAMSTGRGIPLRHQLMDLLSKEPLVVLLLRSPNCFHLNNPRTVPASIGVYIYLWHMAWCRSSLLTHWALSHVSVFFCWQD